MSVRLGCGRTRKIHKCGTKMWLRAAFRLSLLAIGHAVELVSLLSWPLPRRFPLLVVGALLELQRYCTCAETGLAVTSHLWDDHALQLLSSSSKREKEKATFQTMEKMAFCGGG